MSRIFALIVFLMVPAPMAAQDAAVATPEQLSGWISLEDAQDVFPLAAYGEVEVVAYGHIADDRLPVVVHNNSREWLDEIVVRATVRDADGGLIGVGETQLSPLLPLTVPWGDYAFGQVVFDDLEPSGHVELEFKADARDVPWFPNHKPVQLESLEPLRDKLIGEVRNTYTNDLGGIAVSVMCLSVGGVPQKLVESYLSDPQPERGEVAAFEVDVSSDDSGGCPAFLAVAIGYPG